MSMAERIHILERINLVLPPHRKANPERVAAVAAVLGKYKPETIQKAVEVYLQEAEGFPTPKKLKDIIVPMINKLHAERSGKLPEPDRKPWSFQWDKQRTVDEILELENRSRGTIKRMLRGVMMMEGKNGYPKILKESLLELAGEKIRKEVENENRRSFSL